MDSINTRLRGGEAGLGGGGGEDGGTREASAGSVHLPGSCCDAPWIWQIDVNCDITDYIAKVSNCNRHQTAL